MLITNLLTITNRAYLEIQSIIKEKGIPDLYALRIGMKGASCGASYLIGFDIKTEKDQVFDYQEIKILVDKKHLLFLAGVEIDFEEGETGKGFTFSGKEL